MIDIQSLSSQLYEIIDYLFKVTEVMSKQGPEAIPKCDCKMQPATCVSMSCEPAIYKFSNLQVLSRDSTSL